MFKIILSLLIGTLFSLKAYAQVAVFDYQDYLQLISQINLLQEQANYLKQSLNAIQTLEGNQYQWGDVSRQINELGSVISETNGISYNAKNLNDQFQKYYPGYQAPSNFNQQYQQNINTAMNTIGGSLRSLNLSAEDFANEPKRMAFLQSQVQNARGQTQAIQASAQISTEVISQLQLLRQNIMAQSNAQNVYYAQQLQTQASNEAGFNQMIKNGNTHFIPYGSSGHSVSVNSIKGFMK